MQDSEAETLVECSLPAAYSQGFVQVRTVRLRMPNEIASAPSAAPLIEVEPPETGETALPQ